MLNDHGAALHSNKALAIGHVKRTWIFCAGQGCFETNPLSAPITIFFCLIS